MARAQVKIDEFAVDGVTMKIVRPWRSKPFARACIDVMRQRDGIDRSYLLEAKAFNVTPDVIEPARKLLEQRAGEDVEVLG